MERQEGLSQRELEGKYHIFDIVKAQPLHAKLVKMLYLRNYSKLDVNQNLKFSFLFLSVQCDSHRQDPHPTL